VSSWLAKFFSRTETGTVFSGIGTEFSGTESGFSKTGF
jgi:hypothetical protein